MGKVKSIKTDNFKFDVISVDGDELQVRISALIGTEKNPKDGDLLFRFDRLSRNKPVPVKAANLYETVLSYEFRLSQLLALKA